MLTSVAVDVTSPSWWTARWASTRCCPSPSSYARRSGGTCSLVMRTFLPSWPPQRLHAAPHQSHVAAAGRDHRRGARPRDDGGQAGAAMPIFLVLLLLTGAWLTSMNWLWNTPFVDVAIGGLVIMLVVAGTALRPRVMAVRAALGDCRRRSVAAAGTRGDPRARPLDCGQHPADDRPGDHVRDGHEADASHGRRLSAGIHCGRAVGAIPLIPKGEKG